MSAHPQKMVFLAIVSASLLPLAALVYETQTTEGLMLASGLFLATLAGGWIASASLSSHFLDGALAQQEATLKGKMERVRAQAHQLRETLNNKAHQMVCLTDDHQQRATISTSAAAKATENATIISSAIEEMNSAIMEIGRQADEATTIATGAAGKAKTADASASSLSEKSDQILSIVELIRNVAGRTNLLALNATIEAARAGEHGKGFAVVASEVKNLAKQTAEATTCIETQINEIREASHNMKTQMKAIEETVEQINAITKTIKTALHEETAATHEIARSAGETASSTTAVTAGISHMLVTTEELRRAAEGLGNEISDTCDKMQKALT